MHNCHRQSPEFRPAGRHVRTTLGPRSLQGCSAWKMQQDCGRVVGSSSKRRSGSGGGSSTVEVVVEVVEEKSFGCCGFKLLLWWLLC